MTNFFCWSPGSDVVNAGAGRVGNSHPGRFGFIRCDGQCRCDTAVVAGEGAAEVVEQLTDKSEAAFASATAGGAETAAVATGPAAGTIVVVGRRYVRAQYISGGPMNWVNSIRCPSPVPSLVQWSGSNPQSLRAMVRRRLQQGGVRTALRRRCPPEPRP